MWKLGLVEELLVGADGEKRAAVLRVSGQRRELKRLRRPVQKLYPIEMAVETTEQNEKTEHDRNTCTTPVQQPDDEQSPVQRPDDEPQRQPRRAAALTTVMVNGGV